MPSNLTEFIDFHVRGLKNLPRLLGFALQTGTAAGVAAAFRAPVSGILFAMEEGASFWSTGKFFVSQVCIYLCNCLVYTTVLSSCNLRYLHYRSDMEMLFGYVCDCDKHVCNH